MKHPTPIYPLLRATTLSACICLGLGPANAADVLLFGLIKEKGHEQTNSTPSVLSLEPYSFSAFVIASNAGSVSGASVQRTGGPSTPLTPETNSGDYFLSQRFSGEAALNSAYPNVNYTLAIQTALDGPKSLTLNLTSGLYPNAPRIANLTAAQTINPTNPFTLLWDPFVGGASGDLVQLVITDGASNVVFSSPTLGQSNSLDGTAVSISLPVGTLMPGRAYTGNLLFAKVFFSPQNQFIYPNVPGGAAFASRTVFPVRANPALATRRPTLHVTSASLATVTLSFDTEPGVAYRLVTFTNPVSPAYTIVLTTNAASTTVTYAAPANDPPGERYYRVISP